MNTEMTLTVGLRNAFRCANEHTTRFPEFLFPYNYYKTKKFRWSNSADVVGVYDL